MPRVNIELDDELHKKAKIAALMNSQTLIEFVHEALKEKIEEDDKKKR